MKTPLPKQITNEIKLWEGFQKFDGRNVNYKGVNTDYNHTVLMEAVAQGEFAAVKELLDAGADVNAKDDLRQTAFMYFEKETVDSVNIAESLVNGGAEINIIIDFERVYDQKSNDPLVDSWNDFANELRDRFNINYTSPLINACEHCNKGLVEFLVNSGADINLSIDNGVTAISRIDYSNKKSLDILSFLLSKGANVNDYYGEPLSSAIDAGNYEAAILLLKSGAIVDIVGTKEGSKTPVMHFMECYAENFSLKKATKLFNRLYKKVNDFNITDSEGKSLIFYTTTEENFIVEHPIHGEGRDDSLSYRIFDSVLMNKNTNLNLVDNEGNNVLAAFLLSIRDDDIRSRWLDDESYFIEMLLIAGVDPNVKNKNGESASSIAEKLECNASYFIRKQQTNSLINRENDYGETLLLESCINNNYNKVKWLVKHGAEINYRHYRKTDASDWEKSFVTLNRSTALMYTSSPDIVQFLVKSGADIDAKADDGETALMVHADKGWYEGIKALLDEGANANLVCYGYKTAFTIVKRKAREKGEYKRIVDLLRPDTKWKLMPTLALVLYPLFGK